MNIFKRLLRKKTLSVKNLIKVTEVRPNEFSVSAKNGLSGYVHYENNYIFISIKDNKSGSEINYCTEKIDPVIGIHEFVTQQLSDNIFFNFDKNVFPYLRNRYVAVFRNNPDVMDMLSTDKSVLTKPSIHYLNDIYYAEVIIVKKKVIKNVNKVSFHLLNEAKMPLQKAHFYTIHEKLFEIGRFSDFSSVVPIKKTIQSYSESIDVKWIKILKHEFNACLLIKQGRRFKLIVEQPSNQDKHSFVFEMTYESGVIKVEKKKYTKDDYDNYFNSFLGVYQKKVPYYQAYYPSMKIRDQLKEMGLDDKIPLSEDTLTILAMYNI